MRRLAEFLVFGALALGVHVAFAFRFEPVEGGDAGGQGGEAMVTLAAASASVETMVARWNAPPETSAARPAVLPSPPKAALRAPAPTAPLADLPDISRTAIALPGPAVERPPLPEVETAPPPDPEATARHDDKGGPTVSKRPNERPADLKRPEPPTKVADPVTPADKQRPASAASQAQKSAGAGGSPQAGTSNASQVKTLSKAQTSRLITVWGGQIRARVERQKRFPRGARGSGRVVVRITVSRAGQITGAVVARSSGSTQFDAAAMAAVSRTGGLPGAPAGLTDASYTFNLPMDFR